MKSKQSELEKRMLDFRSATDIRLPLKSYVIVMIDGRSFSSKVKKHFKLPFDEVFTNAMNATAMHVCENVSGCKFAFVQSDEISFVITDFDTENTQAFFDYRLCKMQSLIAAMASAFFTRYMISMEWWKDKFQFDNPVNATLYEFDCKAWTVPTYNDAFAWILYRQLDCVRNSKQQAAQTYFPHNRLMGMNVEDQVELLKNEKGIDWNEYPEGNKYGRFVYKEPFTAKVEYTDKRTGKVESKYCTRTRFDVHDGFDLSCNKSRLLSVWTVPVKEQEKTEEESV